MHASFSLVIFNYKRVETILYAIINVVRKLIIYKYDDLKVEKLKHIIK